MGAASEALLAELQRAPTIAELSARSGDDETLVIQALEARHARSVRSLDAAAGPDRSGSVEVPAVDAAPDAIDDRDLVHNLLSRLPGRDRTIVQRRFFDRWTQAEIAESIGCSQMHVSRLLSHSLARLRQMAELELAGVPRGPRSSET